MQKQRVKQTTCGVKLDQETRDRLKVLAVRKDRTPHWLMKRAIKEYLDREETRLAGNPGSNKDRLLSAWGRLV